LLINYLRKNISSSLIPKACLAFEYYANWTRVQCTREIRVSHYNTSSACVHQMPIVGSAFRSAFK